MEKKIMPRISEKEIETSILAYLEHLPGCYAWKNQSVGVYDPVQKKFRKSKSKYSINGVSDILGIYNERFLAIEVKSPTNKKRNIQQDTFINCINAMGGIAFYATSIDEVKNKLQVLDGKI